MIQAVARRCLRSDPRTLIGHEARIRVALAEPLGRRVRVELNNDAQAGFVGQRQQLLERIETIAAALRFGARPVHPRLDAVEAKGLDRREVATPGLSSGAGFRDTIGARDVPPPYHTPIGTNGSDGWCARDDGRTEHSPPRRYADRIASILHCQVAPDPHSFCSGEPARPEDSGYVAALPSRRRPDSQLAPPARRAADRARGDERQRASDVGHHGPRVQARLHHVTVVRSARLVHRASGDTRLSTGGTAATLVLLLTEERAFHERSVVRGASWPKAVIMRPPPPTVISRIRRSAHLRIACATTSGA